ncbi:hypothetical protein HPB48_012409 [Haemaphysalis longicornis]|uniref:Uncharacterized protein n=1 Tax=Haemaphysalis longicornis TaxID=44386 RepID=A0A9J6G350_HAELO|nr:hypothetical protein HPB48_012409 [Haemaphysalis longicornis]
MEENIDISPSVSSTTFTESYVSVGPSSNGHNTPQGTAKIPDCAASILCQLTPPSSKGSEDNSKAFVSSTDSLTSDQELPLILSIPEDDGHGSLNSNSNPGLSFPSLSPGDQLEQELGNSSVKTTESTSSLSQFVLTPPTPHVPASNAQVSVTSSLSKKKDSPEGNTYAYVTSESFPASRNHSTDLHAAGNSSGSKQDCHHASRSPQLQSLPPAKLHTETSCHSFASNAPPALPMYTRGLQFSTAPAASTHNQTHHTSLPGFSTAQGFAAPKEPESLPSLNSGKPPPSPCRMVRDSGRCTTPSKSPSAQFSMSINPYMTTTSFPLPRPEQYTACTSAPTPQSNTQSSTNTALSCPPHRGHRVSSPHVPQISYSAESLIQSQASNPKKDLQGGAKEPGFSNHPGFANRLPYQPQTSTPQHSIGHSHQRQLPAASATHLGHLASTSVAGDSRSQALPMSTAVAPQAATVHSSYNSQRSLATTPSPLPRPPLPHRQGRLSHAPLSPSAHTAPAHHGAARIAAVVSQPPHVCRNQLKPEHVPASELPLPQLFPGPPEPQLQLLRHASRRSDDQPCTGQLPAGHITEAVTLRNAGTLAPPPPAVFGNLSQHCVQAPHLVNNLIPGTFATASSPICGAPLAPPLGADHGEKQAGRREKQSMHPPSEAGCPEPEKQQPKSKSKKSKPSNTLHTTVASIPYFPDFRNESHNHHALITLPPPPAPSQKFSHPPSLTSTSTPSSSSSSSTTSWPHPQQQQQQQHQHHTHQALHSKHGGPEADRSASISSAAYNPLFRPQSQQNSINLNLNGSAPSTPHSSAPPFSHHHSPLQRNLQHSTAPTSSAASMPSMAAPSIPAAPPMAPYTNCAVAAPSQHVPNFNLSNIFPDIGSTDQGRAGAGAPPPPPSTHFYSSSRVLHNSFNHILPPPPPPPPTHNNFVHSGHHAPSFSNVIPPLTFPMHEH